MLRKSNFYLLAITILLSMNLQSQDLDHFRWKNRIILVLAESEDNPYLDQQYQLFAADPEGTDDRKILVIRLTPGKIRIGKEGWQDADGKLYQRYKGDRKFETVLIGLDGGEKMRVARLVSKTEIFGKIDTMPMRRAEMNRDHSPK